MSSLSKIVEKGVDNSENYGYNINRTNVRKTFVTKGMGPLSKNEIELIRIIRENDNPDNALLIATQVILEFLKQPESFEGQAAVCPPTLD